MSEKLTHINAKGDAHMVDVGSKGETSRTAIASGKITLSTEALQAITSGTAKKGDVIATARIAGIMAAKRTSDLIPLCHPLPLTHITIDITPADGHIAVTATVKTKGQTGVEMEALTAVSVTCLTLYDMAKALDKSMVISDIQLEEKHGGKSGTYRRTKES